MKNYMEKLEEYKILNKMAGSNATVFFGTDWLYDIPVTELAEDSRIDTLVYNRSLKGICVDDAENVIDTCVCDLNPGKVFINIGENDVESADFDKKSFEEKFEWMLYTIHSKCNCEIYILSVINDKSGGVNEQLKGIADKYGCDFIDLQGCRSSLLKFFSKVRFFLRNHPMSYCEAMSM